MATAFPEDAWSTNYSPQMNVIRVFFTNFLNQCNNEEEMTQLYLPSMGILETTREPEFFEPYKQDPTYKLWVALVMSQRL